MFIGAPFTKIVQIFPICWKTWPPGGEACFPYTSIVKTLKIFLSKSTGPIWKLFCTNVHWGTLYQDCSNISDWLKNMPARGRSLFLARLSIAQGELLWSPFVRRASCVIRRASCVMRQLLLLSNQWVNWDETSQKASSKWPHRISFNFFGSMQNSGFHGNKMKKTSKFFFSQTGWQIFK